MTGEIFMKRSSGIIMPIFSIASKYGIGTLGNEAYKFVDFLHESGQKYWQILPLGHTGYGNSPYQCFSAFAGNPYFIDLDFLVEEGLLNNYDLSHVNCNYKDKINYSEIFETRFEILRKAFSNVSNLYEDEKFLKFKRENDFWLEDYALYMSIKNYYDQKSFQEWDYEIKFRKPKAMKYFKNLLKEDIDFWYFVQYKFFSQWENLKRYVNSKGIEIIGDIPIYVSSDSSDVWSNPYIFKLDDQRNLIKVAGCPPDDFSATGQLWGNPIYDWEYLKSTGYEWWIIRIRESLKLFDVIRIDHFRGFESFWEVPYGDKTAENGRWVKGPNAELFNAIKNVLGDVKIIAEDLGFMTDEVIKFRDEIGYPGMKVLQFGFGSSDSEYIPHNYIKNCVAYTGTHDNDTIRGWIEVSGTREEVNYAIEYLNLNEKEGYTWGFIRGIWSSVSDIAITTMQDLLDLGNDARMNYPSGLENNWAWRMPQNSLTKSLSRKLYKLTQLYGRCE